MRRASGASNVLFNYMFYLFTCGVVTGNSLSYTLIIGVLLNFYIVHLFF